MEENEWTSIRSKRRSGAGKPKNQNNIKILPKKISIGHINDNGDNSRTAEDVTKDCLKTSHFLTESDLFKEVVDKLTQTNFSRLSAVTCLGIGQLSSSPSSLLQLAMVISSRNYQFSMRKDDRKDVQKDRTCDNQKRDFDCRIISEEGTQIESECCIFDPLFSTKDCLICSSLGLAVSDENKKGKHRAVTGPTLFFMPHCPHRLYINLLWENWDMLENVIILGNSFQSYSIRRSSDDDKTDCMRLLGPLVTECPVWDTYNQKNQGSKGRRYESSLPVELTYLENAFCDLSLHYFKKSSLSSEEARRILAVRPSEADIDEAALLDIELFS